MKFSKESILTLVLGSLIFVITLFVLNVSLQTEPEERLKAGATASTTLSFSPPTTQSNPMLKNVNTTFSVDVMVDPGQNLISFLTLEILYDPTKLSINPTNGFQTNTTAFPTTLEPPLFSTPGRVTAVVSIGSDVTKVINTTTKVGTMTFTTIGATDLSVTQISWGSLTAGLSLSPNDGAYDNVIASKVPAIIKIGGTGGIPTSTPGIEPTCTPLPPGCDENTPNCHVPGINYCAAPTPTTDPLATPSVTPPLTACPKTDPYDIAILFDRSTSMRSDKIVNAKQSAQNFLRVLRGNPNNRITLVTFSGDATLVQPLTDQIDPLHDSIAAINLSAGTCIACGITTAVSELQANGRPEAQKIVLLVTDGRANAPGTNTEAESAAIQAARTAFASSAKVTFYTVGVGADVNPNHLQQLASETGGVYYFAAQPIEIDSQFAAVYDDLNDKICGGQITLPSVTQIPEGAPINNVLIILLILIFIPIIFFFI